MGAHDPLRCFSADGMGMIRGFHTNEAPVKCLLQTVFRDDPDAGCRVIAVTTPEAKASFAIFRKCVRRFCRRRGYRDVTFETVDNDGNFSEVIAGIVRRTAKGDRIYLDTTGGFRDAVYFLLGVVRVLEYSGIRLEKAVYAMISRNKGQRNRLVDVTDLYRMFDLINAANSFTSTGNSAELAAFFADCGNEEIMRVIDVMNRFSDDVTLCRTARLDSLITELDESLLRMQRMEPRDGNEILFRSLSGVIREKFGVGTRGKIGYPDVIRWCLDNRMIQQAVTVFVEKMPEYLFNTGLISVKGRWIDKDNFSRYFDVSYNMLYNGYLRQVTSVTRSPYPLGNLLFLLRKEHANVFREICGLISLEKFSILGALTPDEKDGLLNLIRVKNALFDEQGRRRPSAETEKRKQNTKLRQFEGTDVFETAAQSPADYIDDLLRRRDRLRVIQGAYTPAEPKVWGVADIDAVEHLARVEQESTQYQLRPRVNLSDMQNILRDLIYIRRYIRNTLNHASEDSRMNDEYDAYFSGLGYNVSAEITAAEIEAVLRRAVARIGELTGENGITRAGAEYAE